MPDDPIDDETLRAVEDQLSDEARGLLSDARSATPLQWLRCERQRRRRNRTIAQSAFATAGIVLLSAAAMNWTWLFRAEEAAKTPPVAQAERPQQPNSPVVKAVSDPSATLESSFGAIPILRVETQPDGGYKFTPGWYVPERVRPVDPRQLSPAERSAVSRLLGEDFETLQDQVI